MIKMDYELIENKAFLENLESFMHMSKVQISQPLRFPNHFLSSTFLKIGGRVVTFKGNTTRIAFLFPTFSIKGHGYILRTFQKDGGNYSESVHTSLADELGADFVEEYNTWEQHDSVQSDHPIENLPFTVGRPSSSEGTLIREMQKTIWASDDDGLYPSDIHSDKFNLPTSLVARVDGVPVGFLFGFYRIACNKSLENLLGEKRISIESQLMGILPGNEKRGIGYNLKMHQAEIARELRIDVIHWTVDPLQIANAILNFNKLGAFACSFYPNYYSFRNELNQVPASRFEIAWLVSRRVKSNNMQIGPWTEPRLPELSDYSSDMQVLLQEDLSKSQQLTKSVVAVEIPVDWVGLQKKNIALANHWRLYTDRIFQTYLGFEEDQYVVTRVARNKKRYFLLMFKSGIVTRAIESASRIV
ncbi:MAG: hypothetical protein K8L99_14740 [Anaerolineae bacterium]|nr:hypothetical protein [Anaerolineae bacterium]